MTLSGVVHCDTVISEGNDTSGSSSDEVHIPANVIGCKTKEETQVSLKLVSLLQVDTDLGYSKEMVYFLPQA